MNPKAIIQKDKQQGFTLLEVVIVIILLGVVALTGSRMLVHGYQAAFDSRDINDVDWQLRVAIERMTRDLRHVRSATASDMTIAPNTQITFTNTDNVQIVYQLSGSTLTRKEGAGVAQVLADSVTGLTFTYLNSSAASTVTVTDIKSISFEISVEQGDITRTYEALVTPLNIVG